MRDDRPNRVSGDPLKGLAAPPQPKTSVRELVGRHVAMTREIVASQRAHISKLQAMDFSTSEAERNLDTYLGTLKMLEDHERWVQKKDYLD